MTSLTFESSDSGGKPGPQHRVLIVAGLVLATLALLAWQNGGSRLVGALLLGALGGLALYHAAFGFTAAWRRMARERRGAGLRAQFLLIGLVILISFPLLGYGREIGLPTGGFVFPFGISAALGAAAFGLGMQLAGGCGSGTLFTVGGGSTRMVVALAAFIFGSLVATAHMPFWNSLPRVSGTSVITLLGVEGALLASLALLAGLWQLTRWLERRQHGDLEPARPRGSLLRGPWPLAWGALLLALVSVGTFLVLGRPWGITSAFALWGAKIAGGLGVPVETWSYWQGQTAALERSVFHDATSVMNFGVIVGAFAAAGLAARFAPVWRLSRRDLLTALAGGFLMGYGARLAWGCNIGGFLGGVVSASLHGWWWLLFGYLGSSLGVGLRARLGMDPPLPKS
ncbi:MAG: YeeE/YedE family protein [Pseudomonadota bacterium]